MIKNLAGVVLLILYRVKAEVELGQQVQLLYVLELGHLHDVVEGEVKEAE